MSLEKSQVVSQNVVSQRASLSNRYPLSLAAVFGFAALTYVGANIYIPLEPVPVTLQTLFVLLAGAFIGRGFGALSQLLYVGAGALGVPVFVGGAVGFGVLGGPTGGYLVGFVVAPMIVGAILCRTKTLRGQSLAFLAGTVAIFILGVTHLAVFYTDGIATALQVGFLPFIPGAIIKLLAAVSIYRSWTSLRASA